eukprot:3437571-Pleurochrysis_carterae.AAC.1
MMIFTGRSSLVVLPPTMSVPQNRLQNRAAFGVRRKDVLSARRFHTVAAPADVIDWKWFSGWSR